jgi:hypothetical protein
MSEGATSERRRVWRGAAYTYAMTPATVALERLRTLVRQRELQTRIWRERQPALRAQAAANAAVLDYLARPAPSNPAPAPRRGVDVLLAAPNAKWALGVMVRLCEAFPEWNGSFLAAGMREGHVTGMLSHSFILRFCVDIPGEREAAARRVRSTVEEAGLRTDYSQPLDLLVVTPHLPSAPGQRQSQPAA